MLTTSVNQTATVALQERIAARQAANTYRTLNTDFSLIDLASNDYLGLARSVDLQKRTDFHARQFTKNGATGSRLITGNSLFLEQLEQQIATFHAAESALLFNSGFTANVGVFSSLPQRGDTIISDELVHASIIDGIRLSKANRLIFKHNDLADLEKCLQQAQGTTFIAIESLYSMDGDLAPLKSMVELAEKYGAALIVDEAHATGIFGKNGGGYVQELGLENRVFARIHTFGKAVGVHGAVVVGSELLRNYLINFARSFIYTTAAAPHSLAAIRAAYDLLPQLTSERKKLAELTTFFHKATQENGRFINPAAARSPIQSIITGDSQSAKKLAQQLKKAGFYAKAIVHPTVAQGRERVRICLHSYNKKKEVEEIISVITSYNKNAVSTK